MGLLSSFQSTVFSRQSNNLSSKSLLSKKTKASSLMEVIVASVIIVIIFGIVTLTLNNMIKNNYRSKTDEINNHLNKIVYLYQNGKISIPLQESFEGWGIQANNITKNNNNNRQSYIVFTAIHQKTKKEITKAVLNEN